MKLFFKKVGEGKPLIILHGLFGLGDNWNSIANAFSENGFRVYLVDLRNHGRSGHDFEFNYTVLAEDVYEFLEDEKVEKCDLIGHSMGGKVAMFLSLLHPEKINKMVIADMAPRYYPPHHQSIFSALNSVDTSSLTSRKEAEKKLRNSLRDESTIQFLLKNLYWNDEKKLEWRFGLAQIEKSIEEIGKEFVSEKPIQLPVLFIRGGRSGYINENDVREIKSIFPNSKLKTIEDAGHWVHAEKPKEFVEIVKTFLK
jgi:pimeloyl-ACP methyl ester carboxylesterase